MSKDEVPGLKSTTSPGCKPPVSAGLSLLTRTICTRPPCSLEVRPSQGLLLSLLLLELLLLLLKLLLLLLFQERLLCGLCGRGFA